MKYRKKPVVIEAVQYLGDDASVDEVRAFIGIEVDGNGHDLFIPTLEGTMIASPKDFIIRGVKGEFYPCKPDIFKATYEPVEDA